jgi:predicted dehydrogenase
VSANGRPRIAAIGTGSRWYQKATGLDGEYGSAPEVRAFGDYIAVCDADAERRGRAAEIVREWTGTAPQAVADYRALIDSPDVDIVHISTPDHWHAKIAIEAMRAGKDVYCEKPMTLTIGEGQQVCQVARETGRIVQVGTQQRSDEAFLTAIALVRDGRIGRLQKATCRIGGGPTSPQLPEVEPPKHLDWNLWSGPAPLAAYRFLAGDNGETHSWSRCHYEFRWWYEYSGGKLTDWGAHHVDIATWAMDKTETGPTSIQPQGVVHPVPFAKGYPLDDSRYNTATKFVIAARYADGLELEIRDDGDNGILLEGTAGRIFVNRGRVSGKAVEELATRPLPAGALEKVYKNRPLVDHFRNFFEAVASRAEPVSDVHSHHRALTTCHLAAIAARLGRPLRWDPAKEQILDDAEAQRFVAREPRRGFETEA